MVSVTIKPKKKQEEEKKPKPPVAAQPAKPAAAAPAPAPTPSPQTIVNPPKPTSQVTAAGVPGTQFVDQGKIVSQEEFNQSQLRKQFEAQKLAEQFKQQKFQAQQLEAQGVIDRQGEAATAAEQSGFSSEVSNLKRGLTEQTAPGGTATSLEPPPIAEIIQQDIGKVIKPSGIVKIPKIGEISTSINDPLYLKQLTRLATEPEAELDRQIRGIKVGLGIALTASAITAFTATTIAASVAKAVSSIGLLSKSIAAAAIGGTALALNEGTIKNLDKQMNTIKSESSTILSAVQSGGLSPEEGLTRLKELNDATNNAESELKAASIHNLNFRFNNRRYSLEENLKDTRFNILEKIGGVNQIALQGRPQLQPEQAMLALGK